MATRQTEWAKRERTRLIGILGGRCVDCGTTENLTFDCLHATGDAHHKMSQSQKMCFYRKQFRAGNLTVRCHAHNSVKRDLPPPVFIRCPPVGFVDGAGV